MSNNVLILPKASGPTWGIVKFFYANSLSGLAATSTATGYDVDYLTDMLEVTSWKATSTADQYITFDAGSGNTYSADYLAIAGHNLSSTSATLALEYSTDNFSSDVNDAFTPYTPNTDNAIVKEFTTQDKRYWRIKISGTPSSAVEMAIAIWGDRTELDYAENGLDPYAQRNRDTLNMSSGGFMNQIHTKFTERRQRLNFNRVDDTLYQKIKTWWETNGMKNFFVLWESTINTDDVYLMRPDKNFNSPFVLGGAYRNVSLNLVGRKE